MKFLLLILALTICSGTCSAENVEVVFATGEWPPFSSENLPEYGAATVLVSAICKAGGIKPVYKFYPWKRAERKVAMGEVFGAFPYAVSEKRKAIHDFSEILFCGVNVFVHYDKNPKSVFPVDFESLDDLRGYRIGGISGSFLPPLLKQAGLDYHPTTSLDQSIHKLVAGRIEFCIDDRSVLYDAIQRLYPNEVEHFKTLSKPFGEKKPTAVLVSRTYPGAQEILSKFNNGLAIIKQSGEYDRIIEKYHMTK